MRISDWSSDVCSSDLRCPRAAQSLGEGRRRFIAARRRDRVMGDSAPQIGVIMGSQSDWPTMAHAVQLLDEFGIAHEVQIVSAHRTPDRLVAYAKSAAERGLKAIIAGAGGAAHLPGMVASMTRVPVLGVDRAAGRKRVCRY